MKRGGVSPSLPPGEVRFVVVTLEVDVEVSVDVVVSVDGVVGVDVEGSQS